MYGYAFAPGAQALARRAGRVTRDLGSGRPLLAAAFLAAACFVAAPSGAVTVGNTTGVQVRGTLGFTNDTGEDANDFHIEIYQNENDVSVNGASATSSAFSGGSGSLSERDRNPANDGENHQANFDLDGGTVANGEAMRLDISFWLTKRNTLFIDEWYWTKDGERIGADGHPVGWQAGDPNRGGGGAGGGGAQEGDGGDGNYQHPFSIVNLGNKEVQIADVKLLASMTFYDDIINDIDWDSIDNIVDDMTLGVGETFDYLFDTTGSFLGGHVYLAFTFDDPVLFIGDHPVTELADDMPEPATFALFGIALLGMAAVRQRRRTRR